MLKRFEDVAVDPDKLISVSKVVGGVSTMIVEPREGYQCVVTISTTAADAMLEEIAGEKQAG